MRKILRAIQYAITLDRVTLLVGNEDYKGAISRFEKAKISNLHEWKLPFLLAESFIRTGDNNKFKEYMKISSKNFFESDHNVDEKRYISIYVYKKYGYKDSYVKDFFERYGNDTTLDLRNIRSEIKRYAPMKET